MAGESGKILVVDDDENICRLCTSTLENIGYRVTSVTDSLKALHLARTEAFDLILTDIKMPQLNGIELLKKLRETSPDNLVIFMTGFASVDIAIKALQEGAANLIHKPFHVSELQLAIKNAIERRRLIQENIRLKTLVELFRVSEKIGQTNDPYQLLQIILSTCILETKSQRGAVFFFDPESNEIYMRHAVGFLSQFLEWLRFSKEDGVVGNVFRRGEPILANDLQVFQAPPATKWEKQSGTHLLALPLRNKNGVVGVLALFRESFVQFREADRDFVQILATQLGIALDNVELALDQEILFLETMKSLASALDARDRYTLGHSRRVSALSVRISEKLGLSENDLEIVALAGTLHDIGKIGIQDSILQKPAALTEDEYKIIKTHPEKGVQILKHIHRLSDVVEAVYAHHEWYNGNGYPRGLTRNEIPIYSAILTVADVFDAVTSERPYRQAMSICQAKEIIQQFSGIQFHPEVAIAFSSFSIEFLQNVLRNTSLSA
jgi:putative nucleotidyltransferase with HDIG domain